MGGSVNLQGGGQYQMPGAGYSGMQGSVNAPQTADQYAAAQAAKQQQQPTYPRGPISFNPFTGEPDISYDMNAGADTSNPWTGTPAPVQNPYYAYGNQTAPLMTASEATAYAPMNIPGMQLARPQFYYPSIAGQMASLQGATGGMGLSGMGGYGGYGTSMGGKGMQTSPMMPMMGGYGGGFGMPRSGYYSGLGGLGAYQPMMPRTYPSFRNPYPALGPVTGYQPRDPGRVRAYDGGTSTGGKGMRSNPTQPDVPPAPVYNPDLNPVAPTAPSILSPVAPPVAGPMYKGPRYSDEYDQPPMLRNQPEPQLERSPFRPPVETDTSGLQAPEIDTLLGKGPIPDLTLPGGGVNPDFFVPGSTLPGGQTATPDTTPAPESGPGSEDWNLGQTDQSFFVR